MAPRDDLLTETGSPAAGEAEERLTGVLLLGLLKREEHGIANVGFESLLIIAFYLGGVAILLAGG